MSTGELTIGVLLPDVLGTYSDAGNAVVLAQRARWRGIDARVQHVTADTTPPAGCELYLIGGGEDAAQVFAVGWLASHRALLQAMSGAATTFAVCAGLQILGNRFTDLTGRCHAGVGVLDVSTTPRRRRAVGEIVTRCELPGVGLLTGFENHRGATTLGAGARPLSRVLSGVGNGAVGKRLVGGAVEGALTGQIVATYLHGPVLARNPALADHLLQRATGRELGDLDVPDLAELRRSYLGKFARRGDSPGSHS